jgi:hypothetical protein
MKSVWTQFLRRVLRLLQFSNRLRRIRKRMMKRATWSRPVLQSFEERIVPAQVTWDGGAGNLNWSNPLNWSGDALPGPGDDVFINNLGAAGPDQTIFFAAVTTTVQSVTSAEHLHIASGSLSFAGGTQTLSSSGQVTLGGTVQNATLNANVVAEGNGSLCADRRNHSRRKNADRSN